MILSTIFFSAMDSDSDQPFKRRCTEKDKVQVDDISNEGGAPCNNSLIQIGNVSADFANISNTGNYSAHSHNEQSGSAQHVSRSVSPVENDDMNIEPDNNGGFQDLDENSRSSSRSASGSEEAVMPSDVLVDWVASQNISSFTKPSQSHMDRPSEFENMPSCSTDSRFNRNPPEPSNFIVDDTGELVPVENLNSSSSSSSDSDSSDDQIDSARSDSSNSTFRIQPSRHTEMTLTFGGTGSTSNMTHTVLLGDGCNSRQSVKYVFNFRSMSDSATQTDPQTREIAIEGNQNFPLDFSMFRTDNSSNNSDEDLYPNINRLPSNILLHILKSLTMHELLCRASLVCKCWYNLCRDPDLWRNVELSHQHRVDDIVLSRLTSYSDRVSSINLEDTKMLTSHGISLVCVKCKHLQQLRLTR